jgi:hypothetical protein
MTKQVYYDRVFEILDQAAGDKELSLQEYADLCGEVSSDAQSRCDAAESDIDSGNADEE